MNRDELRMLRHANQCMNKLSEREMQFIDSLNDSDHRYILSNGQIKFLRNIFCKLTGGGSWGDIGQGATKTVRRSEKMESEHIKTITVALDNSDKVSEWEYKFVSDLADRDDSYTLSEKQLEAIYRIKSKLEREGVYVS